MSNTIDRPAAEQTHGFVPDYAHDPSSCGYEFTNRNFCGESRSAAIHRLPTANELHEFQYANVSNGLCWCGEASGNPIHRLDHDAPESAHWESGCVGMVEPEHCGCLRTFPAPEAEPQAGCNGGDHRDCDLNAICQSDAVAETPLDTSGGLYGVGGEVYTFIHAMRMDSLNDPKRLHLTVLKSCWIRSCFTISKWKK